MSQLPILMVTGPIAKTNREEFEAKFSGHVMTPVEAFRAGGYTWDFPLFMEAFNSGTLNSMDHYFGWIKIGNSNVSHHPGTDKVGHPADECEARGCGGTSRVTGLPIRPADTGMTIGTKIIILGERAKFREHDIDDLSGRNLTSTMLRAMGAVFYDLDEFASLMNRFTSFPIANYWIAFARLGPEE